MVRKIRKKPVDFDEAISDTASRELGSKELPLGDRVFRAVLYSVVLVVIIVSGRMIFLGTKYSHYSSIAVDNMNQEFGLPAARGSILDKHGKELVVNEPSFNVRLEIPTMIKNGEADLVFEAAYDVFGISKEQMLETIARTNLEYSPDIVLKRDIEIKQAIDVRSLELESLYIEDGYKRKYASESLSHIVGFVGWNDNDNSLKGRAGLEAYYDNLLRGKDGKKVIYKDALDNIQGMEVINEPKLGGELKTTLDYEFQEYFYNRLSKKLQSLGRTSGVGIALNPQNGEVLALVSLPSFDSNKVADALVLSDRSFFNRAVGGAYHPGSTIKPVHATAVLKENIVSPDYQIFSKGYIEIPNPYFPENPSRFVDWKPHGWVDIHSALAMSSNIYFYKTVGGFPVRGGSVPIGRQALSTGQAGHAYRQADASHEEGLKGLGVERLKSYWEKFGFGKLTGIDLPGEIPGFLPDPEEKEERTGNIWRVGDTYNVSIGQGDLLMNPLQLLGAVSAIANGGKVYKPRLKENEPELLFDISELEPEFKEVRRGMEDAVSKPHGTAYSISDLPFKVAGKTGSAQTSNNTKTNALFVGYGPVGNPEIIVLVLIEDSREGSLNAIPVAEDVLRWYYENRLK